MILGVLKIFIYIKVEITTVQFRYVPLLIHQYKVDKYVSFHCRFQLLQYFCSTLFGLMLVYQMFWVEYHIC